MLPLAKVFRETTDVFTDWLKSAERKVETFEKLVGDQATVTRQNEIAAQINEEILSHKPEFTTLEDAGKEVTELAKKDNEKIKEEFNDVAERWEKLQVDLSERTAMLSAVDKLLGEFHKRLEPIAEVVERNENILKSVDPLGVDVEKNKVETQKVEVVSVHKTVYNVNVCLSSIVAPCFFGVFFLTKLTLNHVTLHFELNSVQNSSTKNYSEINSILTIGCKSSWIYCTTAEEVLYVNLTRNQTCQRNELVQYGRYEDKLSNKKIYLQSKELFDFFLHISKYNLPRKTF